MSRLHSLRQRLARELAPVAPVDVARGPVRRSSLPTLTDTFGRAHTYLRISLTERCSLRCTYCMPPSGVALTRSEELLTRGETVRLATLFVTSGVTKIRLTGGEPTLRPDLPELLGSLSALRPLGLESLCMTSNGVSLSRSLGALKDAGLDRLNLSLDTLRRERFKEITRRDALPKVKQKTNKKHMFFSLSLNVAPPLLPYVQDLIQTWVKVNKKHSFFSLSLNVAPPLLPYVQNLIQTWVGRFCASRPWRISPTPTPFFSHMSLPPPFFPPYDPNRIFQRCSKRWRLRSSWGIRPSR